MPQVYYEVSQSSEFAGSIFTFYPDYVALTQTFSTITPTWNHLWYLAYLLVYILLVLVFLPLLRRVPESRVWQAATAKPLVIVFVLILPFVATETWLSPVFPTTHDLVNDWANHAHRFMIFLIGFFVAKDADFWDSVDRAWKFAPILAIVAWVVLQNGQEVSDWSGQFLSGTSQRFLNCKSPLLRYLTGAIFCYYVLHQTITVVAGYYLTEYRLGVGVESALVLAVTVAGCALGYELIRRVPRVGIPFGVHEVSGYRSGR